MSNFFTKNKNVILYSTAAVVGVVALVKLFPGKDTTGNGEPVFDEPTNNDTQNGFTAIAIANKLYEAMKGVGTDESAILEALTPLSETMFAQVVEAFGKKSYITLVPPFVASGDLIHWLKSELTSSEYKRLKQKYPNIL
jgi:hypothetical protein